MRKVFALGSALTAFLAAAPKALAQTTLPDASFEASISPIIVPDAVATLTTVQPNDVPQFLITLLFLIGLIIAVVFLIHGGIKWILSGGDAKQVEAARNHIVAAIVGLVIVVGAFFILNFVFFILTGQSISLDSFCIPTLADPVCD